MNRSFPVGSLRLALAIVAWIIAIGPDGFQAAGRRVQNEGKRSIGLGFSTDFSEAIDKLTERQIAASLHACFANQLSK
jgi:hypothetical protein